VTADDCFENVATRGPDDEAHLGGAIRREFDRIASESYFFPCGGSRGGVPGVGAGCGWGIGVGCGWGIGEGWGRTGSNGGGRGGSPGRVGSFGFGMVSLPTPVELGDQGRGPPTTLPVRIAGSGGP